MLHGLHVDIVYSHYSQTRYDVTNYFQSAFIKVRKTAENDASDGFEWSGVLPAPLIGRLLVSSLLTGICQ